MSNSIKPYTLLNAPLVDDAKVKYIAELKIWLRGAAFMMSSPKLSMCVADEGLEIAFAGRSNAGKSSAINALADQTQLARASKTPGRTQLINFFSLKSDDKRLVDLPGYGYAAVPEAMKLVWQKELERYLSARKSLVGLVLLMDIRHPLQYFDEMMLNWAKSRGLFVHILLTKADKFNKGPASKILLEVQKKLRSNGHTFSIQLFSALRKQGIDDLALVMAERLQFVSKADVIEQDSEMTTP